MNIELYGAMTDLENLAGNYTDPADIFLCFDDDLPMTEEQAKEQELFMAIERVISLAVLADFELMG